MIAGKPILKDWLAMCEDETSQPPSMRRIIVQYPCSCSFRNSDMFLFSVSNKSVDYGQGFCGIYRLYLHHSEKFGTLKSSAQFSKLHIQGVESADRQMLQELQGGYEYLALCAFNFLCEIPRDIDLTCVIKFVLEIVPFGSEC